MSLLLTTVLFVLYYGYILLIAFDRGLLSRRIGAAVIVGAWVLTAAYVIWANRDYDAEAARLRGAHRRE